MTIHTPGSAATAIAALVVLLASACSDTSDDRPQAEGTSPPTATSTAAPATPGETGDALYYYPPVEGATLTYTTSELGDSTSEVTVGSVTSGPDGQAVAVTELIGSPGADPATVERTFSTTAAGGLSVSASLFGMYGAEFTVTHVGADVGIPPIADLEVGATSSGDTFVELSGAGRTLRNDVSYTLAGVGFERVTVPFGTAEAYVVELEMELTGGIGGTTTTTGTSRFWFVPGFGAVKQEVAVDAGTASAMSTTELTASSVPLP